MDRPPQFSLNHGHPLAQGLVFAGLGRHPNSTYYHDSSHYCYHGLLTNMAVPATSTSGWVWDSYLGRWRLNLDGSNDCVVAPQLDITWSPTSAAAWVNWDGEDYRSIMQEGSGYSDARWIWSIRSPSAMQLRGSNNSTSVSGPVANSWSHLAVTCSNGAHSGLLWYVNGKSVAENATSFNGVAAKTGAIYVGGNLGSLKNGLGDPCIWNRVLTAAEISVLADPSDTMLSGMLKYKGRRSFAFFAAAAGGFKPAWAVRRQRAVGTGVI